MGCMGPNTDHVDPLAAQMRQAVIEVLHQRGIDRPSESNPLRKLSRLPEKWDAEVVKLEAVLHEMIELDACDKF